MKMSDWLAFFLAIFIGIILVAVMLPLPHVPYATTTPFDANKAVPIQGGQSGSILVEANNITAAKALIVNYSWLIYPVQFKKNGQLLNGTLILTDAPIQNVGGGVDNSVATLLSENATMALLKVANITPPNWTTLKGILVLSPSKTVIRTSWYFPWYYYIWFIPAREEPVATYDTALLKECLPSDELNEVDKALTDEADDVGSDEGVADDGEDFEGGDAAVGGDG